MANQLKISKLNARRKIKPEILSQSIHCKYCGEAEVRSASRVVTVAKCRCHGYVHANEVSESPQGLESSAGWKERIVVGVAGFTEETTSFGLGNLVEMPVSV